MRVEDLVKIIAHVCPASGLCWLSPRWDFSAKAINQFDNPHLYFQRKEGVFVFGVKRPGNALLSGLRPLDVILKIGDDEIASLDDLRAAHVAAMAGLGERTRQVVTVLRSGLLCQFVLDYARDFERE